MDKDFDKWNNKKKYIEAHRKDRIFFNERDIWWCSVGKNIGYEENGKNEFFERPVLIIKKFNNSLAWVLPMTSKFKMSPYYFKLNNDQTTDSILLSQLRVISVKRFSRFMKRISPYEFAEVIGRIIDILKYR